MPVRKYRNVNKEIIIFYRVAKEPEEVPSDTCIELYYNGKLPKTFNLRGNRLFYCNILFNTGIIIEKIECHGTVNFQDLKRYVPGIFDKTYIRKIQETTFYNNNRSLIIHLAGKILDIDEVIQMTPEGLPEFQILQEYTIFK